MASEKQNFGIFKKGKAVADTARLGAILCNIYETVYELGLNNDTLYIVTAAEGTVSKTPVGSISGSLKSARSSVFYSEEDADKFFSVMNLKKLNPLDATERTEYVECRIKAPGGGYRWRSYLAHATDLNDSDKRACILCVKDIQDAKIHEEDKNKQIADALVASEIADKAKTELVARLSHEIRTPLNAIAGYSALIKDFSLPEKAADYLAKIDYSAKHLLLLADEILELPVISKGLVRLNETSFDLKEFVVILSAIFHNRASDKNQQFEITVKNVTEEFVIGDRLKLNKILIKLLDNAVKFTPDGGKILLQISQLNKTDERVTLRFEVSDTGVGMPEEVVKDVFNVFRQSDDNHTLRAPQQRRNYLPYIRFF